MAGPNFDGDKVRRSRIVELYYTDEVTGYMLLPSYSKTGMYNYAAPTNTISCTYIIKPISENEIKMKLKQIHKARFSEPQLQR